MSISYMWQATRPAYAGHLEAARRARSEALHAIVAVIASRIVDWRRRRCRIAARRELEALDERMLWDIGLSRADIPDAVDSLLERQP